MRTEYDIEAMAREMTENGFDDEQAERFDAAFVAAQAAAVTLLCAMHGVDERTMLDELANSRNLNLRLNHLVARMEVSATFIVHVHSGLPF
jgi:hypothetical protein